MGSANIRTAKPRLSRLLNEVALREGGDLPRHHDDPFDRTLVAQAIAEGLALIHARHVAAGMRASSSAIGRWWSCTTGSFSI